MRGVRYGRSRLPTVFARLTSPLPPLTSNRKENLIILRNHIPIPVLWAIKLFSGQCRHLIAISLILRKFKEHQNVGQQAQQFVWEGTGFLDMTSFKFVWKFRTPEYQENVSFFIWKEWQSCSKQNNTQKWKQHFGMIHVTWETQAATTNPPPLLFCLNLWKSTTKFQN